MAIKQIKKYPTPCAHPDHEPNKANLEPGEYEHTCDGCGAVTTFKIETLADIWKRINDGNGGSIQPKPYTPWINPYPIYPTYPTNPWLDPLGTPFKPIDLTPRIWCSVVNVGTASA